MHAQFQHDFTPRDCRAFHARSGCRDLLLEIVKKLSGGDARVLRGVNKAWRTHIAPPPVDFPHLVFAAEFGNSLARTKWIISQGLVLERHELRIAAGAARHAWWSIVILTFWIESGGSAGGL